MAAGINDAHFLTETGSSDEEIVFEGPSEAVPSPEAAELPELEFLSDLIEWPTQGDTEETRGPPAVFSCEGCNRLVPFHELPQATRASMHFHKYNPQAPSRIKKDGKQSSRWICEACKDGNRDRHGYDPQGPKCIACQIQLHEGVNCSRTMRKKPKDHRYCTNCRLPRS